MSLLGLPTELLDQVFGYLDWDRDKDLYPSKQSIINGSVTCRQLRKVLLPLVFRDVTLKICWAGGMLVEPALLKLRKECPELARFIKCVYIRTDFTFTTQYNRYNNHHDWVPFRPPADVPDWLNHCQHQIPEDQLATFRQRIDNIARDLEHSGALARVHALEGRRHAEQIILDTMVLHPSGRYHAENEKLLALALVMLCVPPMVESVVLRVLPDGDVTDGKPRFAMAVCATVLKLLRSRLTDVAFVSNDPGRLFGHTQVGGAPLANEAHGTSNFTPETIGETSIQRLTLANAEEFRGLRGTSRWIHQGLERWLSAADTIVNLDLRMFSTSAPELTAFVTRFTALKRLSLRRIILSPHVGRGLGRPAEDVQKRVWLRFAIDVRRAMPEIDIVLDNLHMPRYTHVPGEGRTDELAACGVQWIRRAVLEKKLIDADREERLIEDFDSFLPLWAAEEEVGRGPKAVEEWTNMRAKLSDQAMSRRWR